MSQIFFRELDKYQGFGSKCTSYNSKFHLKKNNNLSHEDHFLNIFFTLD